MAYGINICYIHTLYPKWQGLPVVPSKAALDELTFLGLDLNDVVEILEFGYDCARSKRKKDTFERRLWKKDCLLKVVVTKDYSVTLKTDVWVVVHAA